MVIQSADVMRHPLKYHNFEELKEQDLFEPGTSIRLKNMDCKRVINFMQSVFEKAELNYRNGEHEDAFLLYKRVAHMCDMARGKRDFHQVERSPDGRLMFTMFDTSLRKLTELHDNLKERYEERKNNNGTLTRSSSAQSRMSTASRKTEELDYDFGMYIKPKELMRFISTKKSVLVIDYRSMREDENLCYQDIAIAQVPINVLNPGCIFAGLVKTVPVAERGKLNRLSDYDLVVLMESTNPPTYRSGELFAESPASILMNALTTYNTISRPKRRPLFLDGGFDNWKLHYPMYVSAETHRRYSFYDSNSQFAELLNQIRSEMLPQVEYPDLYEVKKPAAFYLEDQPSDIKRSSSPNIPPRRNVPSSSSEMQSYPPPTSSTLYPKTPSPKSFYTDSTYSNSSQAWQPRDGYEVTEFPAQASAEPRVHHVPIKVIIPSAPPLPDRSTKPVRPPSPFKMSEARDQAKIDKPLPRVPSLQGGARKDLSNSSSSRPIERPPTPDRTKKWALQSEKNIKLIKQVYLNCFNDIQKISRTGNVRSGYTGLFNLGNTCFMNTTLQALFNTPQLQAIFTSAEFFKHINELNTKGTKGVISACFSALLDSVWSGKFIAIRPELFLNAFASEVCADLADKRQHDAQEFQIYLLNALHEDTNKVTKPESFEQNYDGHDLATNAEDYKARQNRFSSSPINDVFNLRTVSQLSCSICRSTSVTFEEMNQISVELPQGTYYSQLNECLAKHFSDIVIHLKRFSLSGGTFVKNEMTIDFETNGWMNMEPYLHSKALKQKSTYSLYAITNHDGTLNSGHYTSFIRNRISHEWLKFDDEYCTAISPDTLKSKKAFILYYTNQNFFSGHPQL